jgi:hypothetical protein
MSFVFGVELSGAPDSTSLTFQFPAGFQADTSMMTANFYICGDSTLEDSGTEVFLGKVILDKASPTILRIVYFDDSGSLEVSSDVTQSDPYTYASGDTVAAVVSNIPVIRV